jgi:thioredoxin reductase (NADPH)
MENHRLMILGTGPAGLTAAIYAARASLAPIVVEGKEPGGQLTLTSEVENFPGFSKGILGSDLMDEMKQQAKRFGAKFVEGWATAVDLTQKPFGVVVGDSTKYTADSLILSMGASAKMTGIPGEAEMVGHGVSTCATCDGFFFRNKKVVVIGGGDSAMEEALHLTKFASEITVVHRRDEFRASKFMQERVLNQEKIHLVMNANPVSVESEANKVTGLKIKDKGSGETRIIQADGVFVAIGHKPNTDFLDGQIQLDSHGYIKTQGRNTGTNIEGVFACGDVMDPYYRQAITAAGSGCKAAMDAENFLEGSRGQHWSVGTATK